jgi:S1-C subfamily serine protease
MKVDILDTLDRVSKSVVSIDTCAFKEYFFNNRNDRKGSGFVVEKNHILTNAHVVKNQETVCIVINGQLMEGKVLSTCKMIDLAMISIDYRDLPILELGDSDKLRIGQTVYIIGNSLGLKGAPTVSSGIISGLQRSIRTDSTFLLDLIQTDAHLNPGNSGGPLIDDEGRVIGVTTAIVPFAQGIGFSIPSNMVKECVNQILTKGEFILPWVGIDGVSVTPRIDSHYNLGVDHGVLVTHVSPGSPADRAGISKMRRGLFQEISQWLSFRGIANPFSGMADVIVSINGEEIGDFEEFKKNIREREIGEILELEIVRYGSREKIQVEVGGIS